MRHLLVLSVLVLACMVASSQGFALSHFIADKENMIVGAAADVNQKKEGIVDIVKSTAEAKIKDLLSHAKSAISSIGAATQSKIDALRATKDAIVSKMAQMKKELSGVVMDIPC